MRRTFLVIIFLTTISAFCGMDFEKRGKWLNVLPMGVGQYQNYQETKALLYFTGESLLLGTTLVTAFLSQGDEDNRKLQKIELASFLGFLVLYSWGVYDAFSHYNRAEEKILKQMSLVPVFSGKLAGFQVSLRF